MIENMNPWVLGVVAVIVGLVAGYFVRLWIALKKSTSLEAQSKTILQKADIDAKALLLDAKERAASVLLEAQKDEKERKQEIRRLEEHLLKREEQLDKEKQVLQTKVQDYEGRLGEVQKVEEEAKRKREEVVGELQRVTGLSREKAREELFSNLKEVYSQELSSELIKLERDKREQVEEKALQIMVSAVQRYAHDRIVDATTSVVEIPDEEIKGKIIGREGRNIKTFERLTGVEVVVDETPEAILLSSYDPYRRELAKVALQKLIKDGRIQPAKIEEKVQEAQNELESRIQKLGEEAAYEVGILDLPKELLHVLGRLNFRTSYGQNVLTHSIEMTHIAALLASELGLKKLDTVKKASLLHDIGKAIDHEVEGTHVEIGRKLLKKYGIAEDVIKGMEAHHEEYPFSTPESYIVAAADAISAARPGARRDTLEKYIKRVEEMERLVKEFDGVDKVYAVSAGREVRVFVVPEKIDDFAAFDLAKRIANKIHTDLQYPGEIKVNVIREIRAVEYAR